MGAIIHLTEARESSPIGRESRRKRPLSRDRGTPHRIPGKSRTRRMIAPDGVRAVVPWIKERSPAFGPPMG